MAELWICLSLFVAFMHCVESGDTIMYAEKRTLMNRLNVCMQTSANLLAWNVLWNTVFVLLLGCKRLGSTIFVGFSGTCGQYNLGSMKIGYNFGYSRYPLIIRKFCVVFRPFFNNNGVSLLPYYRFACSRNCTVRVISNCSTELLCNFVKVAFFWN